MVRELERKLPSASDEGGRAAKALWSAIISRIQDCLYSSPWGPNVLLSGYVHNTRASKNV